MIMYKLYLLIWRTVLRMDVLFVYVCVCVCVCVCLCYFLSVFFFFFNEKHL